MAVWVPEGGVDTALDPWLMDCCRWMSCAASRQEPDWAAQVIETRTETYIR